MTSPVLVLGASGMLGQEVSSCLERSDVTVVGSQRHSPLKAAFFDGSIESLRQTLADVEPGWIINCVGMLSHRIDPAHCATHSEAIAINAMLPHAIAQCAAEHGGRLIHISTDAVFSGQAGRPYDEGDKPDPVGFYAMTKAIGECAADNALTFRCSLIGRDPSRRSGLLEWFLAQRPGASVIGFENQLWNGVTTNQFADLCRAIILNDAFEVLRSASAVYHFCPNPAITKYQLLVKFRSFAQKDVDIVPGKSPDERNRVLTTRYPSLASYYCTPSAWDEPLRQLFDGA